MLTNEQIAATETMSLEELRAMATAEALETPSPKAAPVDVEVIADDEPIAPVVPPVVDGKPTRTIFTRRIDNEDGSGVDVYEADTLEALVDKIAAGKANANKKIRELNSRVQRETQQISQDEEFLVGEKLKTSPKSTMKEIAAEVVREQQARIERSNEVQLEFTIRNPKYVGNPSNGKKMAQWVQTHGYSEFTEEALQNAYEDLSKSGLLELKSEEADGATDADTKVIQRTAGTKVEATTAPSPRKASGLSTRTSTASANKSSMPTVDEAYAMDLDKLRDLANAQLSKGR